MRLFASIFFSTVLMTGVASASSFVELAPMKDALGPSMIALGTPAKEAAGVNLAAVAESPAANDVDAAPLEYPFPGGKVPVIRASMTVGHKIALHYPAPNSLAERGHGDNYAPPEDVRFVQVSPSIIAMAEPVPSISYEEVAAVPETATKNDRRNSFDPGPMVIRGGIVGNGSSQTYFAPDKPAASKPAVRQERSGASSTGAQGTASSQAAPSQPAQKQPDVPIPSPTPAPPPSDIIPRAKIQ